MCVCVCPFLYCSFYACSSFDALAFCRFFCCSVLPLTKDVTFIRRFLSHFTPLGNTVVCLSAAASPIVVVLAASRRCLLYTTLYGYRSGRFSLFVINMYIPYTHTYIQRCIYVFLLFTTAVCIFHHLLLSPTNRERETAHSAR